MSKDTTHFPTSDLELEERYGDQSQRDADGKEIPRDPDKVPDSERVRESWDSLPGEEHSVDYARTNPLKRNGSYEGLPQETVKDLKAPTTNGINIIEIRLSLWDGEIDLTESLEGELDRKAVVEALDRLNSSVMSWLEMRQHQIDKH